MMVVRCFISLLLLVGAQFLPLQITAQASEFANGWTLQRDASSIRFQSVKNLTKVESSGFAEFSGQINEAGAAEIRIFLDSVDTKIDLRNVRMRFLLFETFQFPEAVITAQVDPAALADLATVRRKIIPLPVTLELHGVTKTLDAEVAVTLLGEDLVAISSTAPISVATADFNLDGGVKKLEEAANVASGPSATVTLDFMFARNGGALEVAGAAASQEPVTTAAAASTALEPEGNLDDEACKGRFEILSRTDNIYFASGSANLDRRSEPLLDSLVDIISRCPDLNIEVGGHTDSDGSASGNKRLSERRASAVVKYLVTKNVPDARVVSVGYGEERPVAANDTPDGKRRNRRIEFTVVN